MDENRGNNRGGNNNNGRRNGQNMLWFVIATVVVLLLVTMITNGIGSLTNQEITYSEFQKMVKNNQVKSVVITNSEIQIQPVEDKKSLYQVTYYTVNLKDDRMYEMLDQYNVDYTGKNQTTSAWIYQILRGRCGRASLSTRLTLPAAALGRMLPYPVQRLILRGRRRQIVDDAVDLIIVLLHRKLSVLVGIAFLIHKWPPICRPGQGRFSLGRIAHGQPRPVLRHPASAGKWGACPLYRHGWPAGALHHGQRRQAALA